MVKEGTVPMTSENSAQTPVSTGIQEAMSSIPGNYVRDQSMPGRNSVEFLMIADDGTYQDERVDRVSGTVKLQPETVTRTSGTWSLIPPAQIELKVGNKPSSPAFMTLAVVGDGLIETNGSQVSKQGDPIAPVDDRLEFRRVGPQGGP
jgi:hypothetical protein